MLRKTKELDQPIGITYEVTSRTIGITHWPTPPRWLGLVGHTAPFPPEGSTQTEGTKGKPWRREDMNVPHCLWNLVTLASQAYHTREGWGLWFTGAVRLGSYAVVIKMATCPAIRSVVWAGPMSRKIKNCSVEQQWKGPLDWWLKSSPTFKHQGTNRCRARLSTFCAELLCSISACSEVRLSIFFAKSLCCVHTWLWSHTQHILN